ncbi:hypothetical protein EGW08_005283 [Elysia chlorotica]|uniref:Uncharacterized protein n=1 Tax=Elysia chlorotica TaxID=188477 RepID=A0A433TZQ3_ELYCH|nr:hypothetical protein EGW08_005283 [Elysia chlorotica]
MSGRARPGRTTVTTPRALHAWSPHAALCAWLDWLTSAPPSPGKPIRNKSITGEWLPLRGRGIRKELSQRYAEINGALSWQQIGDPLRGNSGAKTCASEKDCSLIAGAVVGSLASEVSLRLQMSDHSTPIACRGVHAAQGGPARYAEPTSPSQPVLAATHCLQVEADTMCIPDFKMLPTLTWLSVPVLLREARRGGFAGLAVSSCLGGIPIVVIISLPTAGDLRETWPMAFSVKQAGDLSTESICLAASCVHLGQWLKEIFGYVIPKSNCGCVIAAGQRRTVQKAECRTKDAIPARNPGSAGISRGGAPSSDRVRPSVKRRASVT